MLQWPKHPRFRSDREIVEAAKQGDALLLDSVARPSRRRLWRGLQPSKGPSKTGTNGDECIPNILSCSASA